MTYTHLIYEMEVPKIPTIQTAEMWANVIFNDLGLNVVGTMKVDFPGKENAYTLVYALAESHAVIHTTPENNWVEVVIASCGSLDRDRLEMLLKSLFNYTRIRAYTYYGRPPQ